MPQFVGRLTTLKVVKAKKPGMYADGAGLYLQVTGDGQESVAKSWIFRYTLRGRAREMGLGSLSTLGLAEARAKADECRRLKYKGIDPIEARRAERLSAEIPTFAICAERYVAAHTAGWRNPRHRAQWTSTLKKYAEPVIGALHVQVVDTDRVMQVLEPLWLRTPETAVRVRGRIEAVLNWASARGYRQGDNPARWRGHLDKLLPTRARVRVVKHHAALPYAELPGFMATLRKQNGVAARALEFLVLTAARTGEVIGARRSEIAGNVWTVPADRMKRGLQHRVPLSGPTLAIIARMTTEHDGAFLFPGGKRNSPLSNMAMLALLMRMKQSDLTVHGFRSTFRDWAAERTNYPSEVVEMALAHIVESKVEGAYRRADLFGRRVALMNDWAEYCTSAKAAGRGRAVIG